MGRLAGAVAALALPAVLPARADGPVRPHLVAVLQALDKITARTTDLRLPMGDEVAFGTLRITARACLKTPPTEPPESAAFLEINVVDPGTEPQVRVQRLDVRLQPVAVGARASGLRCLGDRLRRAAGAGAAAAEPAPPRRPHPRRAAAGRTDSRRAGTGRHAAEPGAAGRGRSRG